MVSSVRAEKPHPEKNAPSGTAVSAGQKASAEFLAEIEVAIKTIESAQRPVKSRDKKSALTELAKAKDFLGKIREKLIVQTQPAFVNTRCPIMGTPINSAKVKPNLIRDYKGQKVAFCCGGCPAAWDKLSDAEKDAKLRAVAPQGKAQQESYR
jgi:hypothetical protein